MLFLGNFAVLTTCTDIILSAVHVVSCDISTGGKANP